MITTIEQFYFWMQGVMEMVGENGLTADQVKVIKEKMKTVFSHPFTISASSSVNISGTNVPVYNPVDLIPKNPVDLAPKITCTVGMNDTPNFDPAKVECDEFRTI